METEQERGKKDKNKKRLYVFLSFFLATAAASFILPSILNVQERQIERAALIIFAAFLLVFLVNLRDS